MHSHVCKTEWKSFNNALVLYKMTHFQYNHINSSPSQGNTRVKAFFSYNAFCFGPCTIWSIYLWVSFGQIKGYTQTSQNGLSGEIMCFIVIALQSGISIAGGGESAHGSKVFVYCSAPSLTWFKDQQTSRRFTARSYLPQHSHKTLNLTIYNLKYRCCRAHSLCI